MIEQQLVEGQTARERRECAGSGSCHTPRGHSQPHPRQRGLTLPFPPARPDASNIGDICLFNAQRISQIPKDLPASGSGHAKRKVAAISEMETGFGRCCQSHSKGADLACVIGVWREELNQYCKAAIAMKTKHHRCCKAGIRDWHECFTEAGTPNGYSRAAPQGTETPGVVTRSRRSDRLERPPALLFPPGEPTYRNIDKLCTLRDERRRFPTDSLPSAGDEAFMRRAQTIERMESGYDRCCERNDKWGCAHMQWEEALSKFCETDSDPCCWKQHDQRYECFSAKAPDISYVHTRDSVSLVTVTEKEMEDVCQKRGHWRVEMPASALLRKLQGCCPLRVLEQRVRCGKYEKQIFPDRMCGYLRGKWKDRLKCCDQDSASCFDSAYLSHLRLANEPQR